MNPESQKRLEEFIKRVEYIKTLSYFENQKEIVRVSARRVGDKWETDFYQPDDEKRDALLFNLRLFIQDKDDISIGRLTELYSDPEISNEWKYQHENIRKVLNSRLDEVVGEGARGKFTYRDVLSMFLYGKLGHVDQDDRSYKLFQKWVTDETEWAIMHSIFHETLLHVIEAIMNISRISKDEIQRSNK